MLLLLSDTVLPCCEVRYSNFVSVIFVLSIDLSMEGRMDVGRLDKDELGYELAIRGVDDVTTVVEMRKSLRGYLRLERSGIETKYPPYPFKFADDSGVIGGTISVLQREVSEFSGDERSSSFSSCLLVWCIYLSGLNVLKHSLRRNKFSGRDIWRRLLG